MTKSSRNILKARQKIFLYSAIARSGNSGGPIVAQDGRVIGLVVEDSAESTSNDAGPGTAPFYRGIPSSKVIRALDDLGFGGVKDSAMMQAARHRHGSRPAVSSTPPRTRTAAALGAAAATEISALTLRWRNTEGRTFDFCALQTYAGLQLAAVCRTDIVIGCRTSLPRQGPHACRNRKTGSRCGC